MTTEKSLLDTQPKTKKVIKYIPPDGGWGWMVIVGTAASNIFNQSLLSLFSLLYGDALEAMGHEIQGAAIVMSTMLFVSNFSGPIAGAIVKLTSTRVVAITGACLSTSGIFLSGFSTNIAHLMMTYGVLLGLGLGFIQNSSFVAINSYFKKKKSRAVGLANVGTGVGQSLMPHVVRYLLEQYGFQGACLVLSSLSLHGFARRLLSHYVRPVQPVTISDLHAVQTEILIYNRPPTRGQVTLGQLLAVLNPPPPPLVYFFIGIYLETFESGLSLRDASGAGKIAGTMLIQPVEWHMKKVEEEVVLDETLHLLPENKHVMRKTSITNKLPLDKNSIATETELTNSEKKNGFDVKMSQSYNDLNVSEKKTETNGVNGYRIRVIPEKKSLWKKFCELFDLSLLKSGRFLNVIFGTALAVTSIQNFSMLYPFFLQKTAFLDKSQTAMCMSAVAIADIVGRLTLPIFQDKYKIGARWMLVMTLFWLVVVRQILAYQSELIVLIVMSCLYGFGRSMIIIARNIAISENCRLDQVPAAVGLGMLTMGLMTPPVGYTLGWIRDFTDSYIICITAQNALLVVTLIMWIPDMVYLKLQEKNRKKKEVELKQVS